MYELGCGTSTTRVSGSAGSPRDSMKISRENRSISMRHEIVRQRMIPCRNKREQEKDVDETREFRTIKLAIKSADGMINIQKCPTHEGFDNQDNQKSNRFATMLIQSVILSDHRSIVLIGRLMPDY